MRIRIGLAVLAVASCAPQPLAPPGLLASGTGMETFLDQGWSAADRQTFTTTAQGSYLMPLPWFLALRRTDRDAPFAADQLTRYGYIPTTVPTGMAALPVGFVRDGTSGDPQLGMTCAACHTGQLRYKGVTWRIDGGRASADFQAFLTDLGTTARATRDNPARFAAFARTVLGPSATPRQTQRLQRDLSDWTDRYSGFMAASLPDPAWGPGRLDAFGMIFNRVTGLDLAIPTNLAKSDAPVRYPFIWDAPRQDHTQWTGAAPNGTYLRGLARNTGEVFGVFGRFDPVPIPVRAAIYRNSVNLTGLQFLEEKVLALKAPRWPASAPPIDAAQAARGGELFQAQCAECHGIRPSPLVRQAWATTVRDVGTDRRTFDNAQRTGAPGVLTGTQQPPVVGERLANHSAKLSILANAVVGSLVHGVVHGDPGIQRAINRDFAEGRLPIMAPPPRPAPAAVSNVQSATMDLYKLPGGPTAAAYEARVLTGIWAVGPYLHNGSVPSLWELLKPARQRMTTFAVGHREFDPVNVGLDTALGPSRATFTVDPAVGNGNGGREYGTALPETDRRALLEYLKTL